MNDKVKQMIADFLKTPIKKGDMILVKGYGSQNKERWGRTQVIEVKSDEVGYYPSYGKGDLIYSPISEIKRSTDHIGSNPFVKSAWNENIRFYNFSLESVLNRVGYNTDDIMNPKFDKIGGLLVPQLNWDPSVIDENGEEVFYQRPFVWGLKENQNLIDSIYKKLEIGKFIVRARSSEFIEENIKKGKTNQASADIIDGKQRLFAILEFIRGHYPDSHGNYWDDLSELAQRTFVNSQNFTYGEIDEKQTDSVVLNTFLNINIAGIPVSEDHIDFVKSIKPKA